MNCFADSSAIVKLYSDELGASPVRNLGAMYVSQLCRVEVPAALWRKNRMRLVSTNDTRLLVRAFENDLFSSSGPLVPIRVTAGILDRTAALLAVHALRAYDAVQLATAGEARVIDPACGVFAAFDVGLRAAAASQGFHLLPAELP